MSSQRQTEFHIGLIGAGIGGVATATALRLAGARVTVLEAASELGEIGAGIQMTPNVARLLRKWGVEKVIGDNLVRFEEVNYWSLDGRKIAHTKMSSVEGALGMPWWLVHRAHLHEGLVKVAKDKGAELITDARVTRIDHESGKQVRVGTEGGSTFDFDLCIGSDGLRSVVRQKLFPEIQPRPPTTNAAYRAIVPMEQVRADPVARELVERPTMDVWMGEDIYLICYPIANGRLLNLVLSHHLPEKTYDVVQDVPLEFMREQYKDFEPRIKRVINMIPEVSRWPLLVTGPLNSWTSPQKNVVLMGDAAHSMVNHMAQGAATSMEDGAFLARCIAAFLKGRITLYDALAVYEQGRMPKAWMKQQISYLNGEVWMLPPGPAREARDEAMRMELLGETPIRSPNLYGDPRTVLEIYGYDAEADAEKHIDRFLGNNGVNQTSGTTEEAREQFVGWFLPKDGDEQLRKIKARL